MPQLLTKKLLSEARVATRSMPDKTVAAILRSLLLFSDEGILVTDLDHRSLAANEKFGELFKVTPAEVVAMEPEALRKRVYPRLQDPEAWKQQLDEIYARPELVREDELDLLGEPTICLSRTTGPIVDGDGNAVARLWRFRDITASKRRERMRDLLVEISTCRDADPASVCKLVVQKLSDFYKSSAILSIKDGEKMTFREMAGMPMPFSFARSNKIKNAYCQIALRTVKPLLVQDGRKHPELCRIIAPKVGFTRYLGVPICDRQGVAIGTLCIMDGKSNIPLDADDEQLLSMLGLRVATELDRERIYLERTAEQRAQLEQQQQDLTETHQVVTAMNRAFALTSEMMSDQSFIESQTLLLRGLLGYESAAVLLPASDGFLSGYAVSTKSKLARQVRIVATDESVLSCPDYDSKSMRPLEIKFGAAPGPLREVLGAPYIAATRLRLGGVVVFGRQSDPRHLDQRHMMLLEALVDQICLLLTAHTLRQNLVTTHEELKATQQRLIQSEKLSVVGTLAASIAHDIRNIVSSLALECSLGDTDPSAALTNVRLQLDRFAVLAHRLLSYARPKLLSREPAELNELLLRVVALTDAQTRVSGVELLTDFPELPVHALLDASQAEQLFVNLVLNAVQAMRPSGGTIWMKCEQTEDSILIQVKDNGPGIPLTEIERIFEPFHSTRPEGFGLGLYSCKRIADEHGWVLQVGSKVGVGTTFDITIPAYGEQP